MSLPLAAGATFIGIFLLLLTEQYDPAGSLFAIPLVLLILAGHLRLISGQPREKELPEDGLEKHPRRLGQAVCASIVIIGVLVALCFFGQIFERPLLPHENAQLGLMTQVAERFDQERPLYLSPYPRRGYQDINIFPPGLVLPYFWARELRLDWRFTTILSLLLFSGILGAGALALGRHLRKSPVGNLLAVPVFGAMILAGAGWLIFGGVREFLHWGHTPPLLPLIAGLGLALGTRSPLIASVLAGWLACMNPGWLLMLPVIGVWAVRESPRKMFWSLGLMLIWPLIAYGAYRAEFAAMWEGILGSVFRAGLHQREIGSWRFPSLHAFGDFFSLRWVLYMAGLLIIGWIVRDMLRQRNARRRLELVALASLTLVLFGPGVFVNQWYFHLALLAALIPGWAAALAPVNKSYHPKKLPLRAPDFRVLAPTLGISATFIALALRQGFEQSLNRNIALEQSSRMNLYSGWNIPSEDHTWGSETLMGTGFFLDAPLEGLLEIRLGMPGGDFTPFNTTAIFVNGRHAGNYQELPGRFSVATIPLEPDDFHIGFNAIELKTEWKRTFKSLGVSPDDTRSASIAYKGLRLYPEINVMDTNGQRAAR